MRLAIVIPAVLLISLSVCAEQPDCTDIHAEFHEIDSQHIAKLRDFKGTFELPFDGRGYMVEASLFDNFGEEFQRVKGTDGRISYLATYDSEPGILEVVFGAFTAPAILYPKVTQLYLDQPFVRVETSFLRNSGPNLRYQVSWSGPVRGELIEVKPTKTFHSWPGPDLPQHGLVLAIPSEDIPLDDVLHVNILTSDGTPVACFTAHL